MRSPVHRIRTSLAALAAASLALTGIASTAAAQPEAADVLNASDLEIGAYTSDTQVGRFVVKATAASGQQVEVDAHERTGGGMSFTQRLKLNGSGAADYRSIQFATAGEATLTVFALSASASADRHLTLHPADDLTEELGRIDAFGTVPGGVIPAATFDIPAEGTYLLRSPSSGVNIYYLELATGEAPERRAWDDVAAPVITDVGLDPTDPARLLVSYDGESGAAGGDIATASLLGADGGDIGVSGANGSVGSSGTIALTPPASGSYQVQVALTRSGETTAKLSERVAAPDFTLPLAVPVVLSALTTDVRGEQATVTVAWGAVLEAEHYSVAYRSVGGAQFQEAATGIAGTEADISGLRPGDTYEVRVTAHRGTDATTSQPFELTASSAVERWLTTHAGVGGGGSVTENPDGSLTFDAIANNGKIADSEDGFHYYYTEIDPQTENFTLTATFTVDDASQKDNQSGFGIIAVDTLLPGDPSARYFNSAGTMAAKYVRTVDGVLQSRYGIPGGKFVTGYTEAPTVASAARDMSASEPFDWDYRADHTEGTNVNPPKFVTGDVHRFTLRKSNTGFHAITTLNGEEHEVIHYDPDLLLQQTEDSYYVGVFAARKVEVTVSDIEFTTIHPDDDEDPLERPVSYVAPELVADVTRTTPHDSLDVPLVANVHGEASILDAAGNVVAGPLSLSPGERETVTVALDPGSNDLTARLAPAPREAQPQLAEHEELTSYDPLDASLVITVHGYGEPGQALYVSPDGTSEAAGTPADPLDVHTAVAFAQPGQQIVLQPGTYTPTRAIVIDRGNSGTPEAPITLMSQPGSRAVLDLSGSSTGGIQLRGDHWHLYDLEITGSRGYRKPLLISGHHNVAERIESHHNGDTGIQISGTATEPPGMWPSHNLVLSSVSHNNADPLANDADGFAAKLTVGEGNVFRYCIAHHNIDDGWDLYARSTTGPIGVVLVEDSVAYSNGWLEADDGFDLIGEGNGFKLGGESTPGAHVLRNSIAYDNLAKGITSNSGPDVRVVDVTSYHNGQVLPSEGRMNLQLTTNAASTDYEATGVISYRGRQADGIVLREQEDTITTEPSNYLDGRDVTDDWFVSLDLSIRPRIAQDGSIDMGGLLELTGVAPADAGARLRPNPSPTEITLLPPISAQDGGDDGGNGGDDGTGDGDGTETPTGGGGPTTPPADGRPDAGGSDGGLPVMGAGVSPVVLWAIAGLLLGGLVIVARRRVTG